MRPLTGLTEAVWLHLCWFKTDLFSMLARISHVASNIPTKTEASFRVPHIE